MLPNRQEVGGRLRGVLRNPSALAGLLEWKAAEGWAGWLWIALAVLTGGTFVGFFGAMYQWPLPERAVPIFMLLVGGILLAAARVARASVPFALLLIWAGVRAGYHQFPMRSLQVLLLMLMGGLLYAAARDLPDRAARYAAWGFLTAGAWEFILGALNTLRIYPWMNWVSPDHIGKPMGMLTHPNYWGSFMALLLPLVWSRFGIPAAAVVFALILRTISGGPVISASVGVLVMAWPLFGRVVRWGVGILGAGSIVATMTLHEWRLSGRTESWRVTWTELRRWPILGQGLGQYREWAEQYNQGLGRFFLNRQAHNEPLQLWFELGLIGLVLGVLWAWQAYSAARTVWAAAPASILPGAGWRYGRAPLERAWVAVLAVAFVNMWGSPVFHLPGQAAIVLFALARVQADAEALTQPKAPKRGRRK